MESCLSIDIEVKSKILEASRILNISASEISKILIKRVLDQCLDLNIKGRLTEYQLFDNNRHMTVLRYRLSDEERILFAGARFRLCISVSKLLLIGFLLFFNELFKNKRKIPNSYTIIKFILFYSIENFLESIKYKDKKT